MLENSNVHEPQREKNSPCEARNEKKNKKKKQREQKIKLNKNSMILN